MSKKRILLFALGAFLFLILVSGSFRTFVGSAAGGFFGLARDAFSQKEVLLGEIPLGDSKTQGGIINYTTSSAPTGSGAKIVNVVYSSGFEAKSLNEKLKSLEDKIASLSATLDGLESVSEPETFSVSPAAFSSTSSSVFPAASLSSPDAYSKDNEAQGGIIDYTTHGSGKILVSEIMVGADSGSDYEFIELYNAGSAPVDMTDWVIKKKASSGKESSLVASKLFSGEIIPAGHYLLLGNAGGYAGSVSLDISWSSSNTLAYKNNSVVIYDANGYKLEEIGWDEIPKGGSLMRAGWDSNQFVLSVPPTPQNSRSI